MHYLCIVFFLFVFFDCSEAYSCNGCIKNGQCLNVGYKYEDRSSCAEYECKRKYNGYGHGWSYWFGVSTMGCKNFNWGCVRNGKVVQKNCKKFICQAEQRGPRWSSRLIPYQTSCMDVFGNCIAPGSGIRFMAVFEGKRFSNCLCRTQYGVPRISCTSQIG